MVLLLTRGSSSAVVPRLVYVGGGFFGVIYSTVLESFVSQVEVAFGC